MAHRPQSTSARRTVFPWWTSLAVLGTVLWMRSGGVTQAADTRGVTRLSWPEGQAQPATDWVDSTAQELAVPVGEIVRAEDASAGRDPVEPVHDQAVDAQPSTPAPR